jgi:hypothetical protein
VCCVLLSQLLRKEGAVLVAHTRPAAIALFQVPEPTHHSLHHTLEHHLAIFVQREDLGDELCLVVAQHCHADDQLEKRNDVGIVLCSCCDQSIHLE